ncbi:hypothetical protein P7K49_025863 [Saguinus oedipus]|uniref:Cullin family profile domain-containing protein n=1 Tax=Saguinus oedipus TaxID=9490 RepID=A0ABQ9UID3_SAGOE|nr:hypothetical protein P7K49_025863 [Saguinus oedipus]
MYVQTVLDVHKKYNALVMSAFNNDAGFVAALDKACGRFINNNAVTKMAQSSSKSPELLARYCDSLLKKRSLARQNGRDISTASLEQHALCEWNPGMVSALSACEWPVTVVSALSACEWPVTVVSALSACEWPVTVVSALSAQDKDVFQKFYAKMLAKRLVHQNSASDDAEASMISKLKFLVSTGYDAGRGVCAGVWTRSSATALLKTSHTSRSTLLGPSAFLTPSPPHCGASTLPRPGWALFTICAASPASRTFGLGPHSRCAGPELSGGFICSELGYFAIAQFLKLAPQACGFEYTSKLQRMFQDIGVSKDLNEQFKKHLTNSEPLDLDFSIQVLSSGSWPFQQSCTFALPSELERSYQRFTAFYASRHSGRKLTWLYQLSKGELVTNCFKNRYTLQASTFQMAILLQYNTEDAYTVQQLTDSTQIKMVFLLQSLRCIKLPFPRLMDIVRDDKGIS